ncbi:MAG: type I-E CRISPR-associated endonuclease Cas1 [Candidatus Lokiarchaeota archaeon]|nr:type I-E CRISPR-associated endonuclease Cas1 [Candidatus Lokiarchaeota archaeon]
MKDLRVLPRFEDGLSFIYIEHAKIEKESKSIVSYDKKGKTMIPIANISLLMLGPGTSITHNAIKTIAEVGCLIEWCGERGVRFYSEGHGKTRNSRNLLYQATLSVIPSLRLKVAKKMYITRFKEELDTTETIQTLRGKEGARIRKAYKEESERTGVPWHGRNYSRNNWMDADAINRALSTANSCLYGICHAAIVAAGFSSAIGFIHTGKQLSFVYDIADLYKTEITIPLAFEIVQKSERKLGTRVRYACRDYFYESRLLKRIIPDIQKVLYVEFTEDEISKYDIDPSIPAGLWDPNAGFIEGGLNYEPD